MRVSKNLAALFVAFVALACVMPAAACDGYVQQVVAAPCVQQVVVAPVIQQAYVQPVVQLQTAAVYAPVVQAVQAVKVQRVVQVQKVQAAKAVKAQKLKVKIK